jgi:hypothetical protein
MCRAPTGFYDVASTIISGGLAGCELSDDPPQRQQTHIDVATLIEGTSERIIMFALMQYEYTTTKIW